MRIDAHVGPAVTLAEDHRVTRVRAVLRRFRPAQLAYVNEADQLGVDDPVLEYRREILPDKLEFDTANLLHRSPNLDAWIMGQTILAAVGRPPSREAIKARL